MPESKKHSDGIPSTMAENKLLSLYRRMFLLRSAEQLLIREYSTDEIKTPLHLGVGAEAIAVGVLQTCQRARKIYGTYRSHNLFLEETEDAFAFFAEVYGRVGGPSRGRAGSMHLCYPEKNVMLTSAVVGTTIPIAAGHALANKYKNKNELVVVFFGDGAVEPGCFYETINFCKLHSLNILFVCEDNDLAIHAHKKDRQAFALEKLLAAFSIPYKECDGWDIDQVMQATKELEDHHGPKFLHAKYVRSFEHVGIQDDWHAGYRSKPAHFEQFDPLLRYRKKIGAAIGEPAISQAEKEVSDFLEDCLARAQQSPAPQASELRLHVTSGKVE